jgi:hypothetical protein
LPGFATSNVTPLVSLLIPPMYIIICPNFVLISAHSSSPHVMEPRFHLHVHRSPPPVHILSQMKPIHTLTLISFQIYFSTILQFTRSLPSVFASKMLVAFICGMSTQEDIDFRLHFSGVYVVRIYPLEYQIHKSCLKIPISPERVHNVSVFKNQSDNTVQGYKNSV